MSRPWTHLPVPLACAAAALFVSLVALVPAIRSGGGIGSLVRLPAEEPLGQLVAEDDPDFDFVSGASRYDGLYFYAFALDPLATGQEHQRIDAPAYRYGHPGYGWAAGALALGNPSLVPYTLLLLSLVGIAAAGAAASLLADRMGMSPWLGLTVAVNPGLIYAVTADTSEAFAAGVLGVGLVLWLRGHIRWGGVALVALCLIKEPLVAVPIGLIAWELLARRRGAGSRDLVRRLTWLAVGPLALLAWFVYLRLQLGAWSFADGPENLGFPLVGFVDTLRLAAEQAIDPGAYQIGSISLPLLASVGVLMIAAAVRAGSMRSPMDPIFLGFALTFMSLTWLALLFPKDMLRNAAIALYLLPFVLGPSGHGRARDAESGMRAALGSD